MLPPFYALIARQPADEIARQHALLSEGTGLRLFMTGLVYAVSAVYLPLWIVLTCAAFDFTCEIKGVKLMKGLQPAKSPWRYLGTLGAIAISEIAFCTVLALTFQVDTELARPFATGVLALTMLQLGSVRVIHLPYAQSGMAIALIFATGTILWDWQSRSGPGGLALSLICLMAATYFIFQLISANNALYRTSLRESVAARAADLAKSRFLAQMSHELRTPLNAILGLGHAERAAAQDAESRERLGLIVEAARGLGVILDDILDMSAIEAGRLPLRPATVQPAAEISSAVALFRPLFAGQGLDLALSLSPDLPPAASVDGQRLRQCLSNLLSNALKHTERGGARVTAAMEAAGLLAITVADSGRGIAESDLERLFEPFQRGPGVEGGTGLGLSISRALARAMGGDLVYLPSAQGATFRLTLRLDPAQAEPAARPALLADSLPAPGTVAPPQFAGKRVLVVDDIATNRLVAASYLRLFGLTVEESASGEEAVARITRSPPDLVLLDMNMPGLTGIETLQRIRRLPSRASRVAVIAMTADATEAHRQHYLASGLDGYLAKPLMPEALCAVLDRHLTEHEATEAGLPAS